MAHRLTTLTLVIAGVLPGRVPAGATEAGQPAPDCVLQALGEGAPARLGDLRGRVVYVDFWASWCAPCARSIPFMNRLDRDYRSRGLHVLGISVDESPAEALGFLRRVPARFALASDPAGHCPARFGVQAMPSSYLVDRAGVVRYVHQGFRQEDAAVLRARVEELLGPNGDPR